MPYLGWRTIGRDAKVDVKTNYRVAKKFKTLEDEIKRWIKNATSKEEEHTSKFLQEIDDFDKEGDGGLILEERAIQEALRLELAN